MCGGQPNNIFWGWVEAGRGLRAQCLHPFSYLLDIGYIPKELPLKTFVMERQQPLNAGVGRCRGGGLDVGEPADEKIGLHSATRE